MHRGNLQAAHHMCVRSGMGLSGGHVFGCPYRRGRGGRAPTRGAPTGIWGGARAGTRGAHTGNWGGARARTRGCPYGLDVGSAAGSWRGVAGRGRGWGQRFGLFGIWGTAVSCAAGKGGGCADGSCLDFHIGDFGDGLQFARRRWGNERGTGRGGGAQKRTPPSFGWGALLCLFNRPCQGLMLDVIRRRRSLEVRVDQAPSPPALTARMR